jgi:hypothetical protein
MLPITPMETVRQIDGSRTRTYHRDKVALLPLSYYPLRCPSRTRTCGTEINNLAPYQLGYRTLSKVCRNQTHIIRVGAGRSIIELRPQYSVRESNSR